MAHELCSTLRACVHAEVCGIGGRSVLDRTQNSRLHLCPQNLHSNSAAWRSWFAHMYVSVCARTSACAQCVSARCADFACVTECARVRQCAVCQCVHTCMHVYRCAARRVRVASACARASALECTQSLGRQSRMQYCRSTNARPHAQSHPRSLESTPACRPP